MFWIFLLTLVLCQDDGCTGRDLNGCMGNCRCVWCRGSTECVPNLARYNCSNEDYVFSQCGYAGKPQMYTTIGNLFLYVSMPLAIVTLIVIIYNIVIGIKEYKKKEVNYSEINLD